MFSLQLHHIVDLYCLVEETLPVEATSPRGGRPPLLSTGEIVTILIWNTLALRHQTLKDLYQALVLYHRKDFPRLPKYRGFVDQCHRTLPLLVMLLQTLLSQTAPVRIVDSTMLPVCTLPRANSHKVAKGRAEFGKNHQGWHYGFKLHASVDLEGKLCGLYFTGASFHDAQALPNILNRYAKVAVGDTLYGARVMGRKIWEAYGTVIIAPPHPKQKKKIMTKWQHWLLRTRTKIESVFDYLKEHLHLVSSFPRSMNGYLLHYVRILLGYQVVALLKGK
jgi:hypothetical protein